MKKWKDRIREFRGKIVYEILGQTKESNGSFFVVYREYMDGKKMCRNLYRDLYKHYSAFGKPEKDMYKYDSEETPNICWNYPEENELELLYKIEPDFKYIVKKMNMYKQGVFKIFNHWRKHKDMELLLNMRLPRLATNQQFFKFSKEKQKEIVHFALSHTTGYTHPDTMKLVDILGAMKNHTEPWRHELYRLDRKPGITYKEWEYLTKREIRIYDFFYYKKKLSNHFPERLKDPYWTTFKGFQDFLRKENKVNNEIKAIEELKESKAREEKAEKYLKTIKSMLKWNGIFENLNIYIPSTLEDFEHQADTLNQCLIANDYIKKVIEKKSIIVFIKDENKKPLATAEFSFKSKKLLQFYGDELDEENCDPTEECKHALNLYRQKFFGFKQNAA